MLFVSLHFETCQADERSLGPDERREGVAHGRQTARLRGRLAAC